MIFAFDIGGTSIRGAAVDGQTILEPILRKATPVKDFTAFSRCLAEMIEQNGNIPQQVAVSIAGITDAESGRAICANIPCIHGRHLSSDLEDQLGFAVSVANDADCFAMAEAHAGAGRGHRVVLGAILGTGIGGGLVVDGQLINSQGGYAGEWGHAPVAPIVAGTPPVIIPAFPCGCGLSGCIETIASARGIENLHWHLHSGLPHPAQADDLAASRPGMLTAEQILDSWLRAEKDATRTMDIAIEILSRHLAGAINLTGATIVPLGGGLSANHSLIGALDSRVRALILRKSDAPLVVAAQCHKEPALIGAALLAKISQKDKRYPSP